MRPVPLLGVRLAALLLKELKVLLKERRSRIVIALTPLVQLFIFSYAATFDLERIPYAVLDEERSERSRALTARLRASPTFEEIAQPFSLVEARRLLEERRVWVVVHFPQDFTRRGAPVQILLDGRNSNTALATLGYLKAVLSGATPLEVRFWFNRNLESRWFIVPGMVAIITLTSTLMIAALSIAREREEGTFDQLRMTPASPTMIIAGKAVSPFLVGMAQGAVLLLLARLWFGVPFRGSVPLFLLALALYLAAVVGVGLLISALCRTQQQAFVGTFLFASPTILLSGFATPIESMPEPLQKLTLINPMRFFLVIVRRLFLQGADLPLLWPQIWPLFGIALTSLTLAVILVRRRIY